MVGNIASVIHGTVCNPKHWGQSLPWHPDADPQTVLGVKEKKPRSKTTGCRLIFRQGDILLVSSSLPKEQNLKQSSKSVVIAYGERSGHRHVLRGMDISLAESFGREFVVVRDQGAVLEHEEHAAIQIPPGTYGIRRQREFVSAQIAQNPWDLLYTNTDSGDGFMRVGD